MAKKTYTMEVEGNVCTGNKAMWQALAESRFNALYALYCETLRSEDRPEKDEVLNQIYDFIDTME